MADKPAEKISISFKGDKKASSPAPSPTHKRRIEPIKEKGPVEPTIAKTEKAKSPEPVEVGVLDDDISNTVEERPASGGLDGGFAQDMAEESVSDEDKQISAAVDSSTEGVASNISEVETPSETYDEDTVYTGDEEFYSSKLDPRHAEGHQSHKEKPHKMKAPAPRMSPQYILVLATFVTVSVVGVFILGQLEEAREGAGIIFDWLP